MYSVMDGHTLFLAGFASWSLPYCMLRCGGGHSGESGDEERINSQCSMVSETLLVAGRMR